MCHRNAVNTSESRHDGEGAFGLALRAPADISAVTARFGCNFRLRFRSKRATVALISTYSRCALCYHRSSTPGSDARCTTKKHT